MSQPERVPEATRKLPALSREAAVGLMKSGREAMSQGRLEQAIMLFRRARDRSSSAPERPEAIGLLAQALEANGDMSAALTEYRTLLADFPASPQALLAKTKIPELDRRLSLAPALGAVPTGLYLSGARLEGLQEADILRFQQAGINTLFVEAARQSSTKGGRADAGVYFKTDWAPVIHDIVASTVAGAHQKRLQVWAALSIRRMDWVEAHLGWFDHRYRVATDDMVVIGVLDLLHPTVSEYLLGLLMDLAATGVDGILLLADPPSTAVDGFSPFAVRAYERDMGQRLDLPNLRLGSSAEMGFAPDFWRWAGWKQRAHTKALAGILKSLRKSYPKLQVALELHQEAVTNPRGALAWYAEDLLDLRRYRIDYIVMPWMAGLTSSGKASAAALDGKRFLLLVEPGTQKSALGFPSGTGLIYKAKRDFDGLTKPGR